jgi:hypothetical protein
MFFIFLGKFARVSFTQFSQAALHPTGLLDFAWF